MSPKKQRAQAGTLRNLVNGITSVETATSFPHTSNAKRRCGEEKILSFYGVGGVGESRLQKALAGAGSS